MTDQHQNYGRLITTVTDLVDELKLLALNLTVANARLRLSDQAFRAVGGSFNELIDTANSTSEAVSIALKRARGERLTDEEKAAVQVELDKDLERIRGAAERIIETVMSLKKSQRVDRHI